MRRGTKRWVGLGIAVAGVAIGELVWGPAGVAVSFLAAFVVFGALPELNTFVTRAIFATVGLLHGLSIARASGSWLLGAAPAAGMLLMPPYEIFNRWLGYWVVAVMPFAFLAELAVALASLPPTWWHLAIVPSLLGIALFSFVLLKGQRAAIETAKRVKLKVGDIVPDFTLPARLGRGDVTLSSFRGQHVLLCLLRGDWCPVCQVMMRILAKESKRLAERNVKVVAVSPSEGVDADEMARIVGAEYLLVIDPACTVAQHFGTLEPNSPEPGKSSSLPAMVLLDPKGRLAWISTAADVTVHDPSRALRLVEAA